MLDVVLGPQVVAVSIPAGDDVHVMETAARLLLAVALMGIGLQYPIDQLRRRIGQMTILILAVIARFVRRLPLVLALRRPLRADWAFGS